MVSVSLPLSSKYREKLGCNDNQKTTKKWWRRERKEGGKGKKGGRRKEGRDKGKRSDSFKDVLKLTICAIIQVHESQGNVHSQ